MAWKNPFRLNDDGGYNIESEPGPGIVEYSREQVFTLIAVEDALSATDPDRVPGHQRGRTLAKLPGILMPEAGTVIQVAEPNRDVTVNSSRLQVDPFGFYALVYVSDSSEA